MKWRRKGDAAKRSALGQPTTKTGRRLETRAAARQGQAERVDQTSRTVGGAMIAAGGLLGAPAGPAGMTLGMAAGSLIGVGMKDRNDAVADNLRTRARAAKSGARMSGAKIDKASALRRLGPGGGPGQQPQMLGTGTAAPLMQGLGGGRMRYGPGDRESTNVEDRRNEHNAGTIGMYPRGNRPNEVPQGGEEGQGTKGSGKRQKLAQASRSDAGNDPVGDAMRSASGVQNAHQGIANEWLNRRMNGRLPPSDFERLTNGARAGRALDPSDIGEPAGGLSPRHQPFQGRSHTDDALDSVLRNNPDLAKSMKPGEVDEVRRRLRDPAEIQRIRNATGMREDGTVARNRPATGKEKANNAMYWGNRARNHDVRGEGDADTTKQRPAARKDGANQFRKADQQFRAKRSEGEQQQQEQGGGAGGAGGGKRGWSASARYNAVIAKGGQPGAELQAQMEEEQARKKK